jgi:hypothetical protein
MFPQIYVMALITLVVSLVLWGGMIYLFSGRKTRYFWLLLVGLPLSAVSNLIIKQQAIIQVGKAAHIQSQLGLATPAWFLAFAVLISPLIEELIKVAPLLLKPAWRVITSRSGALWAGFTLGVSFGLGEAAFLAFTVAGIPDYASLPWYSYTGFLIERVFTCFAHGVLTAVLAVGIQRRGRFILCGFLAALGLHLFLNAPVVMAEFQWISPELFNLSLPVPFVVLAVIFEWMRRAARSSKDTPTRIGDAYLERPVTQ